MRRRTNMNIRKSFRLAVLDRASEDLDPEAVCDRKQQGELVCRLLAGLEPHHRKMMKEKYFEARTNKQIAEEMGVKPNGLGVTLYNLRKRLKSELIKADYCQYM
jgi:RNA polymerase sigma factor (sigma-70 family)